MWTARTLFVPNKQILLESLPHYYHKINLSFEGKTEKFSVDSLSMFPALPTLDTMICRRQFQTISTH